MNPFFNTPLMNWLQHRRVERLVLGGVATNLVVESTARAADDAGFEVQVLADCCASPNPAWHEFAITQILPLFGSISDSLAFEAELAGAPSAAA